MREKGSFTKMKKLILQVQISIDGFIAGRNGETDWMVWDWGEEWNWDDELKGDFNEVIDTIDGILLSRKMAEGGFISHWTRAAENPNDPRYAYAKRINDTHKVVFTKTLEESRWSDTEIATGDLVGEVKRLKDQSGKNLIVYGGATFLSSLIQAGLVDEFQLFVNPAALGNGLTIFKEIDGQLDVTLVGSKSYECGIVVQNYVAKE